ncbi:MAG: transposase [Sulfurovum sp.]|nr:transposase [Sulfurovum sp.]
MINYATQSWSRSYFLVTIGHVTLDALKKYVDNQGQ